MLAFETVYSLYINGSVGESEFFNDNILTELALRMCMQKIKSILDTQHMTR